MFNNSDNVVRVLNIHNLTTINEFYIAINWRAKREIEYNSSSNVYWKYNMFISSLNHSKISMFQLIQENYCLTYEHILMKQNC